MVEVQFKHNGQHWVANLDAGVDISVPVAPQGGVRAWGQKPAEIIPHTDGNFVGRVRDGASVNFNDIRFNPHSHGTHTECLGHITPEMESVLDHPPPPLMMATLVTIRPNHSGADRVIAKAQLEEVLGDLDTEAVVLRTMPNTEEKKHKDYSGTNPPYLEGEAASWLSSRGVNHLLLDLPSVDREEDGGALAAHKAFWGLPDQPRPHATITEFVYVPDRLKDGRYLMNLQMAAFGNDACPSRPLLFPVRISGV